jgi:hypothetical protein
MTVPLIDAKSQIKNHLHGIKTQVHGAILSLGCNLYIYQKWHIRARSHGFILGQGKRFYSTACTLAVGSPSSYSVVIEDSFPKIKGEHTSLSSAEVRTVMPSGPPPISFHGMVLKHRDFTFFYLSV